MGKLFADVLLAKKTLVEEQVACNIWVRDFDSEFAAGAQISSPKDRSRVAAGDGFLNGVVIELASGLDRRHRRFRQSEDRPEGLKKS
jgi:hypothetical protein